MQPRVHEVAPAGEPADLVAGVVPVDLGQELIVRQPVGSAIQVDHRGDVHCDHAGQLLVGHLDGVLDPVMEWIRPGRADRRLEGVEDQVLGRGAHGVDRYLPAGIVRPTDRGREIRPIPEHGCARAIVEVDLQPLDAEAVVDGAGLARHVPVPEELVAEVQGEIGVDAKRQGVVGGQGLELVETLRVDPLLGDRGPAAAEGSIHRLFG